MLRTLSLVSLLFVIVGLVPVAPAGAVVPQPSAAPQAATAIRWRTLRGSAYLQKRWDYLRFFESSGGLVDLQVHDDGRRIPTIGPGMNIRQVSGRPTAVQNLVIHQLFYPISALPPPSAQFPFESDGDLFLGRFLEADRSYVAEVRGILNTTVVTREATLINAQLTGVMARRAVDPKVSYELKRDFFAFESEDEVRITFDHIADYWFELRLDGRLGALSPPLSEERLALLSLVYQSRELIGQNLTGALQRGDRPSAWYEIRYGSNAGWQTSDLAGGVAKRRYGESHIFGLYDGLFDPQGASPTTVDQALGALAMVRRHGAGTIDPYEEKLRAQCHAAGRDYRLAVVCTPELLRRAVEVIERSSGRQVGTTQGFLDVAPLGGGAALAQAGESNRLDLAGQASAVRNENHSLLHQGEEPGYSDGAEGDDLLVGTAGADELRGGPGEDTLLGQGGDDRLVGGDGDDRLVAGDDLVVAEGGAGFDRYELGASYDSATGVLTHTGALEIRDSDGRGVADGVGGSLEGDAFGVYDQGGALRYSVLFTEAGDHGLPGSYRYAVRLDGDRLKIFLMQRNAFGSWQVDLARRPDFVIVGWSPASNLGINLLDCRADPVTNPSGSLSCSDFHEGGRGGETYDLGRGVDVLRADGYGATAGGDDIAYLGTGNDRADMGPGDDQAYGGPGKDLMIGDAGDDLLDGGPGDDILGMFEADNSEIAGQLHDRDVLRGGDGDDNLLAYGDGKVLEGGAGDDVLTIRQNLFAPKATGGNTLDGGVGRDTFLVERVNAVIRSGAGFHTYRVTEATMREGYTVRIEGEASTPQGTLKDGQLIVQRVFGGDYRILSVQNPHFVLTYDAASRELRIQSRGYEGDGYGSIIVTDYFSGYLGIFDVPGAPPPAWLPPEAPVDPELPNRIYLPLMRR